VDQTLTGGKHTRQGLATYVVLKICTKTQQGKNDMFIGNINSVVIVLLLMLLLISGCGIPDLPGPFGIPGI
jgi:hypothetical protein